MLYYALVFLVIAIVAALLGFGGVAVAFAGVAKILFVLFLILFLFRVLLRKSWLAAAGFVVLFAALKSVCSISPPDAWN